MRSECSLFLHCFSFNFSFYPSSLNCVYVGYTSKCSIPTAPPPSRCLQVTDAPLAPSAHENATIYVTRAQQRYPLGVGVKKDRAYYGPHQFFEVSLNTEGPAGETVLHPTPRTFASREEAAAAYDRLFLFHEDLSGLSPQTKRK